VTSSSVPLSFIHGSVHYTENIKGIRTWKMPYWINNNIFHGVNQLRHDIAESGVKHNKSIKINQFFQRKTFYWNKDNAIVHVRRRLVFCTVTSSLCKTCNYRFQLTGDEKHLKWTLLSGEDL
jgi:hypothetical protein